MGDNVSVASASGSKSQVKRVGSVGKVRTREELHTIGFELTPEVARALADVLRDAADRGESYLWVDKRKDALFVTMLKHDHRDKFGDTD